ncbi:MAG: YbfB/YjiJ family MFS transporter [Burkholderiales bacterium]|nr:YbfB/YjiJ family MFS transporter [Burkholderiales bacterium]
MNKAPRATPTWALALAGALTLAVAMGIGRFAFTPLLPLMMRDGQIDAGGGALLAAANYGGYLLGALSAARLANRPLRLVRACLLATAALTAGAGLLSGALAWSVLRFGAGVVSAWALVGISSWSLAELARRGRSAEGAWVFSGVGVGIFLAGALAWAGAGLGANALWQCLGALALLLGGAAWALLRGVDSRPATASATAGATPSGSAHWGLVFCYGCFGFGYILPATYLPALARNLIDDPRVFGLAWPLFGLAGTASMMIARRAQARFGPMRIWAVCQTLLALGTGLPQLSRSGAAIALSALLVGGSFMVATMAALQQARVVEPANPTPLVGRLTAAFALGQIAGPVLAGMLTPVHIAGRSGIELALAPATLLLAATALWLWRISNPKEQVHEPVRNVPAG